MTTHPLGRLSGSIFAALLAVSAAGCAEDPAAGRDRRRR